MRFLGLPIETDMTDGLDGGMKMVTGVAISIGE